MADLARFTTRFLQNQQLLVALELHPFSYAIVIWASSIALAAASPHVRHIFREMWNSGTEPGAVPWPSDLVTPEILAELAAHMDTGEIVTTGGNVPQLVSGAELLHLAPLSAAGAEYLNEWLQPANAFQILRFASAHNLTALKRNALACAAAHWNASGGQEISDLPTPFLIEMMSMDKLAAQHEPEVIRAGIQHLAKMGALDATLDLPELSVVALLDALKGAQEESERSWGMLDIRISRTPVTVMPPTAAPQFYIIGGCRRTHKPFSSSWKYDMHRKTWHRVPPMNTARWGLAAASSGGRIYAVGGFNRTALATAEVFDPVTNKWSPVASMRVPRYWFALAELEGKLYSFGGAAGGYVLTSIEAYDPVVDEWSEVGHMPRPRCGMSAVTYGGAIYVVGGARDAEGERQSAELWRYEPAARGRWRQLAPMPHRRFRAGVVLGGSHLYALGGLEEFSALSEVERYDFRLNKWMEMEKMPIPRQSFAVGAAGGTLVAAGGHFRVLHITVHSTLVHEYDETAGRWTEASQLSRKRSEAASVVLFT